MPTFSPLSGLRHPLQKRRRPGALQRHLPFIALTVAVFILYMYMMPDQLLARLLGSGTAEHINEDRGLVTSDSRVRIERVAPEKWTVNDVGVWLGKEVSQLQRAFIRKQEIAHF